MRRPGIWGVYPRQHNPLAPTTDPASPTEVPAGDWDVAVFESFFPTLREAAHDPPTTIVETRPGKGACEVVVFTQDPTTSLGQLSLAHLETSSAALEVALLRALRAAFALPLDAVHIARLAQRAVNDLVGPPVGIMDPMASSLACTSSALFLDTRSRTS